MAEKRPVGKVPDLDAATSLPAAFFAQTEAAPDAPMLWSRQDDTWTPQSRGAVAEAVRDTAAGLRALGLAPGERVVLVCENRPEFAIADLAIMTAGAITVPAYTTNTIADHAHVIEDSEAAMVIVATPALARRVLPAANRAPCCRQIVGIDPGIAPANDPTPETGAKAAPPVDPAGAETAGAETAGGVNRVAANSNGHAAGDTGFAAKTIESLGRVQDLGRKARERAKTAENGHAPALPPLPARTDTACLIYTSGTGGRPKGVMLSHGNILSNCRMCAEVLEGVGLSGADETFLCFLPLSHAYEHTAGLMLPLTIGAQIYYSRGVDQLGRELQEVRPTIMTAVPRLYELLYHRITGSLRKESPLRQRLFARAVTLGTRRYEQGRHKQGRLGPLAALEDKILDRLVRRKVQARFGGRLKGMVSGGAALNHDIGLFFTALGLRILQGYGQTEASPVIACNWAHAIKLDTVGPPLNGVEVKLAPDNELLMRGPTVMQGYWRLPDHTTRTIVDGWLHTGDLASIDDDGFIRITDRKKDIVVLSGGDTLSPARVEGALTRQPEIAQAMVHGDRRPHLVALIVPDEDFVQSWAREQGRPATDPASVIADVNFQESVDAAVRRVNREVSGTEKIRRFRLLGEPFTVENAMMTPTLKIRRHKIRETYAQTLEAMY